MADIGANLRALRQKKHLSQEQLAETLHVTRQAVSNWERGVTEPDVGTLSHLAGIFDVTLETLVSGTAPSRHVSRRDAVFLVFAAGLLLMSVLLRLTVLHRLDQLRAATYDARAFAIWSFVLNSAFSLALAALLARLAVLTTVRRFPCRMLWILALALMTAHVIGFVFVFLHPITQFPAWLYANAMRPSTLLPLPLLSGLCLGAGG